jgi:hypothetical protein
MLGYLSRTINILALIVFSIICFVSCLKKKKYIFTRELGLVILLCLFLVITSLLRQLYYDDVKLSMLSGILYVAIPIIDAFLIINTSTKEEIKKWVKRI